MFPAAESVFIITAPETSLGLCPSLFLVAATASNSVRPSSQIQRRRVIFLEMCWTSTAGQFILNQ